MTGTGGRHGTWRNEQRRGFENIIYLEPDRQIGISSPLDVRNVTLSKVQTTQRANLGVPGWEPCCYAYQRGGENREIEKTKETPHPTVKDRQRILGRSGGQLPEERRTGKGEKEWQDKKQEGRGDSQRREIPRLRERVDSSPRGSMPTVSNTGHLQEFSSWA